MSPEARSGFGFHRDDPQAVRPPVPGIDFLADLGEFDFEARLVQPWFVCPRICAPKNIGTSSHSSTRSSASVVSSEDISQPPGRSHVKILAGTRAVPHPSVRG